MACCDAKYRCTLVDFGDNGRESDGEVYMNSKLGYAIDHKLIDILEETGITGANSTETYPYVLVGDDIFSLKTLHNEAISKQ